MVQFKGNLWLADVPASRVAAELIVDGEDVVVATGDRTIGRWKRAELAAKRHSQGYLLVVEGEELIFDTDAEELIVVLEEGSLPVIDLRGPTVEELPASEPGPPPPPIAEPEPIPAPPPRSSGDVMPLSQPRQRRRAPKPPAPEPPPTDIFDLLRPPPAEAKARNHPLALAAIALGILGTMVALVPRLVLLAVAFSGSALAVGLLARSELKRRGVERGQDVAITGAVLGAVGLVMGLIVALT
ncbi:MAG TPA: DUF4190 domain-containing protein [Acidimicrobiia bacterium]|nr:DUF4190 domain-containing protein [Acidimicrobiia bacterium]